MASSIPPKRSRATAEQLNQMVDFLLRNPGLAANKFLKLHGKFEHDKKWSELAVLLNSIGGAVKTVDQWYSVWKDLKSRTSIKLRDRRKQQALTGNRPINQEPISDLEKRVVALIGNTYIKGHEEVKENVPEEEEFQLRLEEDDDVSFDEIPSTSKEADVNLLHTPQTPKTPRRCLKRKRVEEEDETRAKFLEIAKQQANSIKLLAECSAANVKANELMAKAIETMGEGLKHVADALKHLASSIDRI